MQIHSMWDHYPSLKQDLIAVLNVIEKNIKIRDKTVERNIKELIYAGGKLLRPAYFLLCSKIGPDYDRERSIAIAAALEVLHLATLVHDDIIDDAPTRRGMETIQSKYGKDYAVYTGDYLFCVCFKILSKHVKHLSSIEIKTNSMEKVLLGELDQMNMRYNMDMTVRQYLTQIAGKTAQLFSLSCYSGAETSDAKKLLKNNARRIGHNIGMAFQIMDDILDYTQDSTHIGKPVLNDVKQGVYSLPLIYGINTNKKAFQPYLEKKENMTDHDLRAVLDLIDEHQCVENSKVLALKYTNKAINLIHKLPNGQHKEDMLNITRLLLTRTV